MKANKAVLLSMALAFVFSSILLAGGEKDRMQDHSLRTVFLDGASKKGVRDDLPDLSSFKDHSFQEGVQNPVDGAIRAYYPNAKKSEMTGDNKDFRKIAPFVHFGVDSLLNHY
jgi:hypothetical protein